jgi:sarcosine oxidase, subunit beta
VSIGSACSAPATRGAAVVIVGGGVIGCSIAWHLARGGQSDVLVLERNDLASGATARSAGLVSQGRLHVETLQMIRRTREAIAELEAFSGEPVGFHAVGTIRIAASEEREAELTAMDAMLGEHGVAVERLDAMQVRSMAPAIDASQARRISRVADDGYVDAYRLTQAYAAAARALGVRFRPRTSVAGIAHDGRRVLGVDTDGGRVHADVVVDAAGAWGIGLALGAGVPLGTAPVRSHYWITAPDRAAPPDHPVVYLPDARAYLRPELGGLLIGVQEPQSRTYDARTLPDDIAGFGFSEPDEAWSVLADHAPALRTWIPRLDSLALAHHVEGLSTYTPDGRFLLGAAGGIAGLFVASGCCGTGVSASGGIGDALASVILGRSPSVDLSSFRPDRFGAVDPYDPAFRERCAAARAGKSRRL